MSGFNLASTLGSPGLAAPSAATIPHPAALRGDVAGARKSAEDFTAFFLSQSLESMYANVAPNSVFGGGNGEAVYRSLMIQEYGKVMSQSNNGLGIVDDVQREILRLQESIK
jgi:flagellar protein FlgJ